MLAKTIADAVLRAGDEDVHDILHHTLTEFHGKYAGWSLASGVMSYVRIADACRARGEPQPSAGVLLLVREGDQNGRLAVASVYIDRKSTRLNSSHSGESRMPSSA